MNPSEQLKEQTYDFLAFQAKGREIGSVLDLEQFTDKDWRELLFNQLAVYIPFDKKEFGQQHAIELMKTAIQFARLGQIDEGHPHEAKIVILDHCRYNPFMTSPDGSTIFISKEVLGEMALWPREAFVPQERSLTAFPVSPEEYFALSMYEEGHHAARFSHTPMVLALNPGVTGADAILAYNTQPWELDALIAKVANLERYRELLPKIDPAYKEKFPWMKDVAIDFEIRVIKSLRQQLEEARAYLASH